MLILFVKKSVFDPKFEFIDLKRTNYKALSLEGFVPLWVNLLPQNECGQWMSCLSKVNFQKKYYNLQTQSSETFCANWLFYCLPFFYGTCRSGFIDILIKTFLRFRPIKVDSLVNTDNAECLSKFKLSITRPSNFCFGFSQIFFDQVETVLFLLKWLSWWWSWVIFLKCLNHEIALSHISLRNHHQRLSPSQTSGTFPPSETSGTFSQPPNIRSSQHPKLHTGFYHSKPPTCFHNRPPSSEALTIGNLTVLYEVLVSCI